MYSFFLVFLFGGVLYFFPCCCSHLQALSSEDMQEAILVQNNISFAGMIYPNLNDGNMRLDYYLKDSQEGLMLIFDVTGKLVKSIRMNSNANSLVINETELKQGIYLFKILVNGELIVSDKLVIIK